MDQRILIIGNGGSGKSWLARRLAGALAIPVIHLDDMHWEPGNIGVARDKALRDRDVHAASLAPQWIMEGVYGQLAQLVIDRVTELVWLDLPIDDCVANVRARGKKGGETDAQLQDLIDWVSEYCNRPKNWNSFDGHLRIFDAYVGAKVRLHTRTDVDAYAAKAEI